MKVTRLSRSFLFRRKILLALFASTCDSNSHGDGNSHSYANGDTNTDAVRRKMYSDASASLDAGASPVSG